MMGKGEKQKLEIGRKGTRHGGRSGPGWGGE